MDGKYYLEGGVETQWLNHNNNNEAERNNILNGKPQSNMFFTQHSFPLIENRSLAASFVCIESFCLPKTKKNSFSSMAKTRKKNTMQLHKKFALISTTLSNEK